MLQICDMASQRTVILATVAMRITSNTPRHEIYFHSLSKTKANEQKQQQQKIPHKIETRPFELVHWFFIVCVFLFVAFGSVHSYIYIYIHGDWKWPKEKSSRISTGTIAVCTACGLWAFRCVHCAGDVDRFCQFFECGRFLLASKQEVNDAFDTKRWWI